MPLGGSNASPVAVNLVKKLYTPMVENFMAAYKGDILVVDDVPDNVRLLSTMLTTQGYKVRKIIKGELTLEVAQVNPPDLILLDIMMPNVSGFDVCRQLKAEPKTRDIPIIFLSASDETLDKIMAFSVGGEDYITKPFEIREVVARIENQLRVVRLQQQLIAQNYQLQQEVIERKKAQDSLQEINQTLEERVQQRTAELTQANQQLKTLGEELQVALSQEQELSCFKSRIITTISHEYRTPLGIISSSTGLLEEYHDRLTPDMRNKHLKRIQDAVKHITKLIEDVLFLNRPEGIALAPNATLLDLQDVTLGVVQDLQRVLLQSDRITLEFEGCDLPFPIDREVMQKILSNLLSNAVKFSTAPNPIHCYLCNTPKTLTITVVDYGIGIPLGDQSKVFTPFYRASNVGNAPGTGIGLSVVRRCVDACGGQVSLVSQENQGSTFTVTLPWAMPALSYASSSH